MIAAQADWLARCLAIGAIVVGLVSPGLTLWFWRRSGSWLKVTLQPLAPSPNRLEDVIRVEVHVRGFQPATVREIQLGRRVPGNVINGNQQYRTDFFIVAKPTDGRDPLPRPVSPSDFIVADVEIVDVASHCGWETDVLVIAGARRGDDTKWTMSKVKKVKIPRPA